MSKHETNQLCSLCSVNTLKHVHCSAKDCSFVLVVCDECDKAQAVAATIQDHARDHVMPLRRAA